MFPVADQFSLAFDAVPAAQLENNSELKSFYDGVKMTQGELLSAFERNKVSEGKNLKLSTPNFLLEQENSYYDAESK